MRPLIAVAITILLFAGVYGYTSFVDSIRRPPLEIKTHYASGSYKLKIRRNFDCGAAGFDLPSLVIRFRNSDVLLKDSDVPQSETIEIDPLPGVEQNENEIFIEANIASPDSDDGWGDSDDAGWDDESEKEATDSSTDKKPTNNIGNVVRVQVFRGDELLTDQALWGEPGAETVSGTISFSIQGSEPEHDHE